MSTATLTTTPVFAVGDRVITVFGEPARVIGRTTHDHIYVIEVEGVGPAVQRLRTLTTDMFSHEPTV